MRVRTQAIGCVMAMVVFGTAIELPDICAEWKAERAAAALRERITCELPPDATLQQAQEWAMLNSTQSWTMVVDGPHPGLGVVAHRPWDNGGIFHRPQSFQIKFEFSTPLEGQPARLSRTVVETRPYLVLGSAPGGRFPVQWIRAFLWMPGGWLVFLGVRHSHRLYRAELRRIAGRCPDCNYPMGPSDHCSECGREIASISPRR